MPQLSRWYVRTSFLYLAAGFLLGGLLLAHKGIPYAPGLWRWLPVHIALVLFGWIVQFTMGVAFWILPRWGVVEKDNRGNELLARLSYGLLNAGLLLLSLTPLFAAVPGALSSGLAWSLLALAAILFLIHAWPRIKPFLT